VVSALYLLVHFVDDSDWVLMLVRALDLVAPSGVLLLADEFPEQLARPAPHVVLRPRSSYAKVIASRGFAFDDDFRERFLAEDPGGEQFWIARRSD
jgi:hypothetical protein